VWSTEQGLILKSFERIKQIVIKEFIQVFRDKRMRFFLFVPPLVQLFVFGYVVTLDVSNIPTAILDLDKSYESRELARRLESSGYFTILHTPASVEEVTGLLDRGKVLCVVQINRGFMKDLRKGVPTSVQVIVDGTYSNTALVALNYANTVIARFARDRGPRKSAAEGASIDLRVRAWYNPDLKSKNYFVPGVMASIILLVSLMLTSMAVVRERESGTMEQLMVTPIKPIELILGKTIPFAAISFIDMMLVTAVGVFWFEVPIRGSLLLLLLCTAIYLLSVLGTGLFISTVARTQQQALMAAMFFNMPAILLSGFAFPIENMPAVFQYVTYLNPLRYFLIIIRGVFLKGNGIVILWPQMAALLAIGMIVITLSALRFRKRLG
jgi:ABC-2 type transport system permease protein